MRLAFLAAAAQLQCRVQGRRYRHRPQRYSRYRRRRSTASTLFLNNLLDSLFNPRSIHSSTLPLRLRTRTDRPHSSFPRIDHFSSPNRSSPPVHRSPDTIIYRSKAWPFLAFCHLVSLSLFLFTTTITTAATDSSMATSTDQEWTPSAHLEWSTEESARGGGARRDAAADDDSESIFDGSKLEEELKYPDDEDGEENDDSCTLLEYFLSPSRHSSASSNIVRRSVDSTSQFSGLSNPDIDNVFEIWLRASRSGGTGRYSNDEDEDDLETSWPLQRPRTRHRYQHYRNTQSNNRISSSSSSRRDSQTTTATRRPRVNSTSSKNRPTSSKSSAKQQQQQPIIPTRPRSSAVKKVLQCKLFDENTGDELCSLEVNKRVEALRYVYTKTNMGIRGSSSMMDFHSNTNTNNSNVTLYELFALGIYTDAQKSRPRVSHLAASLRPCIISTPSKAAIGRKNATTSTNDSCRTCYRHLLDNLRDIDSRHDAFTQSVLSMIDCEPDNDLEQFSPTSNCSECKLWYKRWLLVIFSHIWRQKPCLQWCHLAELACPHLPPVRKHDYAGLPSFRCTDPEISSLSARNSTYGPACDCIHPCDTSAHTVQWGWDISSELSDFCRDYRKRDKSECGQTKKTTTTTASSSGRPSAKRKKNNYADRLRPSSLPPYLTLSVTVMVILRLVTV